MKEWLCFIGPDGRELCSYTVKDTFPGEMQATKELLAAENDLRSEEIVVKLERRRDSGKEIAK